MSFTMVTQMQDENVSWMMDREMHWCNCLVSGEVRIVARSDSVSMQFCLLVCDLLFPRQMTIFSQSEFTFHVATLAPLSGLQACVVCYYSVTT